MKAVMPAVSDDILHHRKATGADRYDEMWEGVLHMPPMPNRFHQNLNWSLETYLRLVWVVTCEAEVYYEINVAPVGGWPHDYRVPDLVILLPDRYAIDRNEYFEGAPTIVIEIRSPDDEAYDKLAFYAALGVPEVWIINRDSCEPEIHVLKRGRYKKEAAAADGWIRSSEIAIEMRQGDGNKLAIRLAGDEERRENLPPD